MFIKIGELEAIGKEFIKAAVHIAIMDADVAKENLIHETEGGRGPFRLLKTLEPRQILFSEALKLKLAGYASKVKMK